MDVSDLTEKTKRINESSATIRARVMKARAIQEKRFAGTDLKFNSEMSPQDIKKYCKLGSSEESYLEDAFCRMELSARAYHKILRVARTIADIDGSENIQKVHLMEAISYRLTDGKYWHQNEE